MQKAYKFFDSDENGRLGASLLRAACSLFAFFGASRSRAEMDRGARIDVSELKQALKLMAEDSRARWWWCA